VFVDHLNVLHPFPLVGGEHIVYYSNGNKSELFEKLDFYRSHPEEARRVAINGYLHAMKYHRTVSMLDYVLRSVHLREATLRGDPVLPDYRLIFLTLFHVKVELFYSPCMCKYIYNSVNRTINPEATHDPNFKYTYTHTCMQYIISAHAYKSHSLSSHYLRDTAQELNVRGRVIQRFMREQERLEKERLRIEALKSGLIKFG
jgi:hypothetical protein